MPQSERSDAPTDRRATILQAAKAALLERGVEGVSMDDVARRAGTTKRTVYAHMRNKQALVDAVVEESTRRFLAGLPDPAMLHDDPVEAVVRYAACVDSLLTWQDPIRLQRMVLGELWRTPEHGRLLLAVFEQAEQRLARYLRTHGVMDPERCASLVLAALVSRTHLRLLFGADAPSPTRRADAAATSAEDQGWRMTVVRMLLGHSL